MLQVGNNAFSGDFKDFEESTHFALWAFAKAPLFIGTDSAKKMTQTPPLKFFPT
jgi:hypothetical protein